MTKFGVQASACVEGEGIVVQASKPARNEEGGDPSSSSFVSLRVFVSSCFRRLHHDTRGATATEYLLILALIIIPIACLLPLFLSMINRYSGRVVYMMRLPFP